MDSMVQWVLEGANKVNRVQTLILALEGCVLCVLACAYMWRLSTQVRRQVRSEVMVTILCTLLTTCQLPAVVI
jgi:hypothetical protein